VHLPFDAVVADLPVAARGAKALASPHTPWRLLAHMRIAQWDILEFCTNPKRVSPNFSDGYWAKSDAPAIAGRRRGSWRKVRMSLTLTRAEFGSPEFPMRQSRSQALRPRSSLRRRHERPC
jgi:hypothetical protein